MPETTAPEAMTSHRLQLPSSTSPQAVLTMITNVRPEATLEGRVIDLGEGARLVQDSGPRREGRWTIEVPRLREDPAPEGLGDSHGYAEAFPEGLPFGVERSVLDLCWSIGRRFFGAVVSDSGVRLEPHPHHVRDLTVTSPHQVDAASLLECLEMVEPGVAAVGEVDPEADAYLLSFPIGEDVVEIRVSGTSSPMALRSASWIDGAVDYAVVHVAADPEEDATRTPDEAVQARWSEAYLRIGRVAAVIAENVGGYVVDLEGFLVDPADLV